MTDRWLLIIFGIGAIPLSFVGISLLLRWITAQRVLIDVPNERSSHKTPTPRGGGLLIVLVTLIGVLLFNGMTAATSWLAVISYVIGAALIAGISWLDDLYTLSSRVRFLMHIIAALLLINGVGYWENLTIPFIGEVYLGWAGLLITFIVTAGMTNAYNFMDGIDGIAGGQAVIAGLGWAGIGLAFDQPAVAVLGALVAGSSLGFLGHNWSPARIFMGDVGSAFLGYTFAALTVFAKEVPNGPSFAWVGIFLLWPFLFDTTLTIMLRLQRGENILEAHRSHLYQRLVILGDGHATVSTLYIGLALLGVGVAWLWITLTISTTLAVICLAGCGALLWAAVQVREQRAKQLAQSTA